MKLVTDYDVVILSETWLSRNTAYNVNIDGDDCYHVHRGGISVYYKHELRSRMSNC